MVDRLPPAPTNTALARLVRRMIDTMPWVMARDLRKARTDLSMVRHLNACLREENFLLERDYRRLFHSSTMGPVTRRADLRATRDDCHDDTILVLTAEYEPKRYSVALPNRTMARDGISAPGAEALKRAALEIARGHVPRHTEHLIRSALGGKTIEEFMKGAQRV